MKTRTTRIILGALGAILAIAGAFILIFAGILPVINPGFAELHGDNEGFSVRNLSAIILGLLLLSLAFFCSKKASSRAL